MTAEAAEGAREREMPGRLGELARLFLKLGCIAFGGPAAHVALMREEVVRQRAWVTDQEFLDLVGATNLIPGPNSTELAIHLGFIRAGWRGLVVAGACFIGPAVAFVLAFAWAYVRFGATPAANWLLYGVQPVIVAVVALAVWGLARTAVRGPVAAVVGLAALAIYFVGVNELLLLLAGALATLAAWQVGRARSGEHGPGGRLAALVPLGPGAVSMLPALPVSGAGGLAATFLTFLKIGSVLYGSGYVLLAFLRADLVERLGWLTERQLLDAVAVGQFTPGPVFTTATFVGYVVGGWGGAAAATLGIFLPAFVFVALSIPLLPRLRRSGVFRALLDGVNVASLALMAGVSWQLGRAAIVDPLTLALAVGAALILARWPVNSAWLVLGGGLVGLARSLC